MNTGRIMFVFFAGVIVGAAYGILYAPKKGSDTRKMILDSPKKLAEDGMDALQELRHIISQYTHTGNGHNGHEKKG